MVLADAGNACENVCLSGPRIKLCRADETQHKYLRGRRGLNHRRATIFCPERCLIRCAAPFQIAKTEDF